ncbi:MAG: ArsR/SmtB family transcription factor [Halobacteriales archaeon]
MARLLPSRLEGSSSVESDPRVIGLDSEDADDLLAAMSSETARRLLSSLHDSPATPSELADRIDTSIQNAQYHLEKLEDAGAIEVADTVYSEKGREMSVYAPADEPLVVVAGDDETGGIRAALARLLAGVGLVGVVSAAINAAAGYGVFGTDPPTGDPGAEGDAGVGAMDAATQTPAAGGAPIDPAAPGTLFFIGGLSVLVVGFLLLRLRR